MYQSTPYSPPRFKTLPLRHSVALDTPIKAKSSGSRPHSSSPVDRDAVYQELARETMGRFVGPIPLREFVNYYLRSGSEEAPMPPVPSDLFASLKTAKEPQSYPIVVGYHWNSSCTSRLSAFRRPLLNNLRPV
jgi:hypothetical protein